MASYRHRHKTVDHHVAAEIKTTESHSRGNALDKVFGHHFPCLFSATRGQQLCHISDLPTMLEPEYRNSFLKANFKEEGY